MSKRIKQAIANLANRFGYHVGIAPPLADSLSAHLQVLFDRYSIDTVVDVGAFHGEFADMVRGFGFTGRIVSFEPVSESFELVAEKAADDPAWEVHRLALGARNRSRQITVFSDRDLSSFYEKGEYAEQFMEGKLLGDKMVPVREEAVEERRLDEVLQDYLPDVDRIIGFLKIDTQGHDLQVLEGAKGVLEFFPALQAEVAFRNIYRGVPTAREAIQGFEDAGYSISGIFPVNYDLRLRLLEADSVFVERDEL